MAPRKKKKKPAFRQAFQSKRAGITRHILFNLIHMLVVSDVLLLDTHTHRVTTPLNTIIEFTPLNTFDKWEMAMQINSSLILRSGDDGGIVVGMD
ncbi:hypothetical protein J6590_071893 [Homalodisca vitripennis]|nr:hypothetical protein J6590_071893 [Homalodisca vitripennis]